MIQAKLGEKEYVFIEVPNNTIITDTRNLYSTPYILEFKDGSIVLFEKDNDKTIYQGNALLKNQSQIISTTNNITEELAESIVDKFVYNEKVTTYKDYMYLLGINPLNEELFDYMTAVDSFKSFMNSLDLDITKNYILIEIIK